jgi:hypothetical protein
MSKGLLSDTPTNIQPYELETAELLSIGRLIRATATIEYIITLYLCKMADITEGQSVVLMGRMPASARLKLAETFAAIKGQSYVDLHEECFNNEHYIGLVRLRNTVVHGFLMGKTESGLIALAVQEHAGMDENKIYETARAYAPEAFKQAADVAEGVIPQLIDRLELRPLLDKRRAQALDSHPKARRQTTKKKAKHARPPQS